MAKTQRLEFKFDERSLCSVEELKQRGCGVLILKCDAMENTFDKKRLEGFVARLGEFFGDRAVDYCPASEHCDDAIFIRGARTDRNCASVVIRFSPRRKGTEEIAVTSVEIAVPLNGVLREFGVIVDHLSVPIRPSQS